MRLLDLSIMEMMNFVYADLMDGADANQRARITAWLEGRLGPGGGIVVEDEAMKGLENVYGKEAPEWWGDGMTNQNDTFSVNL